MRPASIISLVIAVLLIVVGLVSCFIAQNMAKANGEFLFSEDRGSDLVTTVDLTDSEISKIELIASKVQINIYGRQDKSYIEFVNFKENYYSLSNANRVLSFDEIPDIKSMLKFWENGFSFKGMRYIFNFNNTVDESKDKVINVYLSNDKEIKIFDIKSNDLVLNISNMTTGTDYNITTQNAVIDGNVVRTSSTFNINSSESDSPAEKVDLKLSTALIQYININAKELNLNADKFRCAGNAVIKSESGAISLGTISQLDGLTLDLVSTSGKITLDGSEVMSPYTQTNVESSRGEISIHTDSSDISIYRSTSDSESVPEETR